MTTDQTWYYVNQDSCEPLQPSFKSNLISLYGLDDISQSVARTNADGSKGVKLRKSYKNHVSDLSGKHNIHSERKTLLPVLFGPMSSSGSDFAHFDHDYLQKCIKFEKSPPSGVSGFDSANLAIDDKKPRQIEATAEPRKRTKTSSPANAQPPPLKKRHVQVHFR